MSAFSISDGYGVGSTRPDLVVVEFNREADSWEMPGAPVFLTPAEARNLAGRLTSMAGKVERGEVTR